MKIKKLILPITFAAIVIFATAFKSVDSTNSGWRFQQATYDWKLYKKVYNVSIYTSWIKGGSGNNFVIKVVNENATGGKQVGIAFVKFYSHDSYSSVATIAGTTKYIKAKNEDDAFIELNVPTSSHADNFSLEDILVY